MKRIGSLVPAFAFWSERDTTALPEFWFRLVWLFESPSDHSRCFANNYRRSSALDEKAKIKLWSL